MSAQLTTKWYGIHKLQETMGSLTAELARLSADPHDLKPSRSLVSRVELKMADVMAALQWFEYHNKLDVLTERMERDFEMYDACQLKSVPNLQGQTLMPGIVTLEPESVRCSGDFEVGQEDCGLPYGHTGKCKKRPDLVLTLSDEQEPETLPSTATEPESSPESAEVSNGRG